MGNKSGQAIVEFILVLPFLLMLLVLPFILSDMVEKKYRHRISAGNLANIDVVKQGGSVDESLAKTIESLSMGTIVEGDLSYVTPIYSTIERRSSVYNGFSNALSSDSTNIYNPIVEVESFLGKDYSYVTFLLGEITRVQDTHTISQLKSQITFKINPTEIDLLLKSTNPTDNDSASGFPLSLSFNAINFNETLVAYHPSDYNTGGLIGWVAASVFSSKPTWGGSGYSYSWSHLGVGDFSSQSESVKSKKDLDDLKDVFESGFDLINQGLDELGNLIPGIDSKDQAFSISCPFQYRATNSCRVALFGVGQPLYPMYIELFTAIAAAADIVEEAASLGEAYASKKALKETLERIAKEIMDSAVKALEDKAKEMVEEKVKSLENDIKNKVKDTYESKANELKQKVSGIFDDIASSFNLGDDSSSGEDKFKNFTDKLGDFAKNFK